MRADLCGRWAERLNKLAEVSYEITLPHKAFAAGTTIPVSLKFTPLMKGVRITSLTTTIKEQACVAFFASPTCLTC